MRIDNIPYMIKEVSLKMTKDSRPYLLFSLQNKQGQLTGIMWDTGEDFFHKIKNIKFVSLSGNLEAFNNKRQIIIEEIKLLREEEVNIEEFIPSILSKVPSIISEITLYLEKIENPYLKQLVFSFLEDKSFMEKFSKAPAAEQMHNAYMGGLIEHTCNVIKKVYGIWEKDNSYNLNKDILLAGAFLHDIGKIEELTCSYEISYTDKGRLLGHILIGAFMVKEKIEKLPEFPQYLENIIIHIILSHHGKYEWGSPVLPATPEAYLIHIIDNLEVKLNIFVREIQEDLSSSDWTPRSRIFDRRLYKRKLEEEEYGNSS